MPDETERIASVVNNINLAQIQDEDNNTNAAMI